MAAALRRGRGQVPGEYSARVDGVLATMELRGKSTHLEKKPEN
jgi:hypothetical protein